ncbi:MAG: formylglycine-generating enzyme family protein [Spirochaetota bacterium]
MLKYILIIISALIVAAGYSLAQKPLYDKIGKVETVRKDKFITVLLDRIPDKETYSIIDDNAEIGKVSIIILSPFTESNKLVLRALAEYSLKEKNMINAGATIGYLKDEEQEESKKTTAKQEPTIELKTQKDIYKDIIFTSIDYKEMILIPGGEFLFGSDTGDKDEKPQQIINIDDFYIDKYEVSNSDYYIFISKTNSKPPASWQKGKYNEGSNDNPVLVSYHEALKYAEWAHKRLPTEEEWEKAARGKGLELIKNQDESFSYIEKPLFYPWGNAFDPSKANSLEFWVTGKIGEDTKKKFGKGLLPVYMFRRFGDSVYGIVNMSGNAAEWTSSWYNAYAGNSYSNKMFGKQVKVIRGGSWFNSKEEVRTTDRRVGGLPNLYTDNIAGFRCAKDPTIIDRK